MEAVGPLDKNNKKNRRTMKRNKDKNKIMFDQNIRCVGVNAAGLTSKMLSFDVLLQSLKPNIFSIQETKLYRPGKIKTDHSKKLCNL